jgi:pimeloyl-ACP methyl ester carboxylesterase
MAVLRSVDLRRGVRLQYVEQGAAGGVPVVLLHGFTDSWRSFEGVLAHLPRSVRALAVTQRGHGDASRPAHGYRLADFAADVAAFVEALDLGPVLVAGHCMGSHVARRFALDYPALARGLVLASSFYTLRGNPGVEELAAAVTRLRDPVDAGFVREFQESTLARPVAPEFLEMVVEESLKVPARVWQVTLAGLLEAGTGGELARIQAPTFLVWGDRDTTCSRRDQEQLAAAIPGAELIEYPGVGHALHWEEPARFAADLAAAAGLLAAARVVRAA